VGHRIEFSPEALGDLIDLYDYIALRDGAERAISYIELPIAPQAQRASRIVATIFRCLRSAASGATTCAAAYEFSVSNAAR